MPNNKHESLIFTIMMCFVMVLGMSLYNAYLIQGHLSVAMLSQAWLGFPFAYIVAMALDVFVVSKNAKTIAFKYIIKPNQSQAAIGITISICMVIPMVICMSGYGAVVGALHTGVWHDFLGQWMQNIGKNVLIALPLQLLIAGPIVRKTFRRVFPVGVIQG
ncbi:DUF2798 domain-containing protein [Weissella viridescens]|uniref:DUF2798 domain-containing protein n=1 Tax=Weissella viridescens TaxID=1629 RepID=A0A3P2RD01_WEIVI|nr:DUF2798 domain-containing protein [Weissella viridescens]RRG18464.1 DUF2798 domain-containing protein [Weissella viridescens]